MLYRTIKTDIWGDPWFVDLSPESKILFVYLFTNRNVSACGSMQLSLSQIAFETKISVKKVERLLIEFGGKVLWLPEHNLIVVRNFYKHQRSQSSGSYTTAALKAMEPLPAEARGWLGESNPDLKDTHTPPSPLPVPTVGGKEEAVATVIAEGEEEVTPPTPSEGESPKPKRQAKQSQAPIPTDFQPTPEMIEKACGKYGLTVDQVIAKTDRFKNWAVAKGQTYANWDSGWLNFMEPKAWDGQAANGRASPPTSRMSQTAEIFDELRRERGEPTEDDANVLDITSYQNGGTNERTDSTQRSPKPDRPVPVEAVRSVRQDGGNALPQAVHRRP